MQPHRLPHTLNLWHESVGRDPRRYVLEVTRTLKGSRIEADAGRLYVEVRVRGKVPTYREVRRNGPTYREVLNSQRGLMERIAEFSEEERAG